MANDYRMNEGRCSGYHYIFTDRMTGAVITEGDVTGGNKTDCMKLAWLRFNEARDEQHLPYKAHNTGNDEVKLFMKRNDEAKGTKLQEIRKSQRLTQREVAERSGISIRLVQDYEQGHKDINRAAAETVRDLARALGVRMEDILEG